MLRITYSNSFFTQTDTRFNMLLFFIPCLADCVIILWDSLFLVLSKNRLHYNKTVFPCVGIWCDLLKINIPLEVFNISHRTLAELKKY